MLLRFGVAFLIFTFGPGACCGLWLTRSLDLPQRVVASLGIGVAAGAVVIDLLGRLGWLAAFPYLSTAMTAMALVAWRRAQPAARDDRWRAADLGACALILMLAAATGYLVFAHRVSADAEQIVLRGDYDSLDLSYYAAISAEATHTVPPTAPYYAGRELNYAYYPQLVLAMVHRFARVPMLDIYFKYAWPAFLMLAGLSAYLLVRALAPPGTALLAVVLMMVAGDFSYLAAWYLPHADFNWDYVLWPTNFLSPTMESLHFNSWTPSLPVMFTGLWCVACGLKSRAWGWLCLGGFLFGVLFQFKPFAVIVLWAALCASILFARGDREARRRMAATLILSGVFALPYIYRSVRLYADRRSELRVELFQLPQRMLIKLDLVGAFNAAAARLVPIVSLRRPLVVGAATLLFFLGGLGIRWLGWPAVWRALRNATDADPSAALWRLLAWTAVAGTVIPFFLVTQPYNDTLQFYQTGLYVLWIFTAITLARVASRDRALGRLVVAAAIVVSLPSSIHYLHRRWTDGERAPLAALTRAEIEIAGYLRTLDPHGTVVLNDRPLDPSLMAVVSERRIVLAWGRYAVGSAERLRDVEAFYGSTRDTPNLVEILRRQRVTHVIVHAERDRVHPEVLAKLKLLKGDAAVQLYEVPPESSRQ